MLQPGGRVIGMTLGQFSMIDLLGAVLDVTGPAHVKMSTWTVGIRDAHNCGFMLDAAKMLSFELYVDKSFPSREPAYCGAICRMFGPRAVNAADLHAKVATIRNGAWNVSIRGSMNLNTNPRGEQFDMDDSTAIADFFDGHFDIMRDCGLPLGHAASNREVDAVFDRIRRGVNPFGVKSLHQLQAAGVPFGEGFQAWVNDRLARNRSRDSMPKTTPQLAKEVGMSMPDLLDAMRIGAGAACEDVAAILL